MRCSKAEKTLRAKIQASHRSWYFLSLGSVFLLSVSPVSRAFPLGSDNCLFAFSAADMQSGDKVCQLSFDSLSFDQFSEDIATAELEPHIEDFESEEGFSRGNSRRVAQSFSFFPGLGTDRRFSSNFGGVGLDKVPLAALDKHKSHKSVPKNTSVVRLAAGQVVYDVPYEALEKARKNYRSIVGKENLTVPLEERYIGSLMLPESELKSLNSEYYLASNVTYDDTAAFEGDFESSEYSAENALHNSDKIRYSAEKTYTVMDGRILEVETPHEHVQHVATSPSARVPEGFVVQVESSIPGAAIADSLSSASTSALSAQTFLAGGASSQKRLASSVDESKVALHELGQARERSFSVPSEQKAELRSLASGVSAELGSASKETERVIRGKVLLPSGILPQSVVLRIAGTDLVFLPDSNGYFEIPGMPIGSKFELIVWDTGSYLSRKAVSVAVGPSSKEVIIQLDLDKTIVSTAQAFGVKQDKLLGGFCATLVGVNANSLEGGRISLLTASSGIQLSYFSENSLPSPDNDRLTRSGRFCFFNVDKPLVDFKVELLNGVRRSFSVVTPPTFFDNSVVLNLGDANYRPVTVYELVDSRSAYQASQDKVPVRFGGSNGLDWLSGVLGAVWSPVFGGKFRADAAYAEVNVAADVGPLVSSSSSELLYLPIAQELQEVSVRPDEADDSGSFSLFSVEDFITFPFEEKRNRRSEGSVVAVDRNSPLAIFAMSENNRETIAQLNPQMVVTPEDGTAFVSVDLAKLGISYADFSVAVKQPISGDAVGKVTYIPLREGLKNPRHVRFFISSLPEGQYSLQILDRAAGVVKWFDVVRSRPGKLQVVSVKEK